MLGMTPLPAAQAAQKHTVIAPRYKVRIDRHIQVPMRDGTKLSADLIRPDADGRFPAIIEYIPYRKDDLTQAGYDTHYYFAERGLVGVRLDVRGTGSSEGVNTDEYMPVEQKDGYTTWGTTAAAWSP
jgi:putative CocE/NonD family hydrolase